MLAGSWRSENDGIDTGKWNVQTRDQKQTASQESSGLAPGVKTVKTYNYGGGCRRRLYGRVDLDRFSGEDAEPRAIETAGEWGDATVLR